MSIIFPSLVAEELGTNDMPRIVPSPPPKVVFHSLKLYKFYTAEGFALK